MIRAITSNVADAQIIGKDENDVGLLPHDLLTMERQRAATKESRCKTQPRGSKCGSMIHDGYL
jgi:hypothetical protein